jgi:hypothetical protein
LRVGLYVYGTPGYGSESGYVKKLIDLTDDLDSVYGQLTPLRTDGGDEYVARVVRAATLEQPWNKQRDALKIIVVAGNEAATQDTKFDSLEMAKQAITSGSRSSDQPKHDHTGGATLEPLEPVLQHLNACLQCPFFLARQTACRGFLTLWPRSVRMRHYETIPLGVGDRGAWEFTESTSMG